MIFFQPNFNGMTDNDWKAVWIVGNILSIIGTIFYFINYNNPLYCTYVDGEFMYRDLPEWMGVSLAVFCGVNGIALLIIMLEFVSKQLNK